MPFSPGKNSSEREAEGGSENTQVWGGGPGQKHGLQLWLVFAWMSQLDFPIGLPLLIRLQSEFFGKPGHHLSTTSSAETGKLSLSPSFPPSLSGGFPFLSVAPTLLRPRLEKSVEVIPTGKSSQDTRVPV